MPTKPPVFRPHGVSAAERERLYDRDRSSTAHRRLYDGPWPKASKDNLQRNPLCRYCQLDGRVAAATLTDHFWPHHGNAELFWDRRFWISSCDGCHSGMKQATERAGLAAMTALAARLGLPPRPLP